jgi:hypothetical protein
MKLNRYLIFIFILFFHSLLVLANSNLFKEYIGLNNTQELAIAHFQSEDYENAKLLFQYVIKKDVCGCFWESVIFLSSIYTIEGFKDSAYTILDAGRQFPYFMRFKYSLFKYAHQAVKKGVIINPRNYSTFRHFAESEYPVNPDSIYLETYIKEYPEPIIGSDSLTTIINQTIKGKYSSVSRRFLVSIKITIDSSGTIHYLESRTTDVPYEIEDIIIAAILNTKWKPAVVEGKKVGTFFLYYLTLMDDQIK